MSCRTITASLAVLAGSLLASASAQAISITTNSDVAAGQAAFGTANDAFNFRNLFAPGSSWALGVWGGPAIASQTLSDPVTGAMLSTTEPALDLRNWIDGPGFDNGSAAAPDLAVSGTERFTLNLAALTQRLGFAVSVGTGLLPSEVNTNGNFGVFTIVLYSGVNDVGNDFLLLPNQQGGATYWVDIQSATAFDRVVVTDVGNQQDEYFSNFVTGSLTATGAIPEPSSWALLIAGFGLVGAAQRRRRPALS